MNFWNWLTSPSGVPVLVGIIGVLGTIVAVAATVITQLQVEKHVKDRETARFNWERERYREEAAAAEKARFEELKRDAYVAYVINVLKIIDYLNGVKALRLLSIVLPSRQRSLRAARAELEAITVKIRLLSPETHNETYIVGVLVDENLSALVRRDIDGVDVPRLYEALQDAVSSMQRSLRISDEKFDVEKLMSQAHNQEQLNKTDTLEEAKTIDT